MCGRFALGLDPDEVASAFGAEDLTAGAAPAGSFNIAPTMPVPVVVRWESGRLVGVAHWGLVPSWAAGTRHAARRINARAESVADRPAFRSAYARRRCLVPVSGWYEWAPREDGAGRQAYYLTAADGSLLALAGLWEVWGEGAARLRTFAVVTTATSGQLRQVHSRMPLVLPRERWAAWLGEESSRTAPAGDLLAPPPAEVVAALEVRPVGAAVGDVRNAGRALTERADPDAARGGPHWRSDPLPLGLVQE